MHQKDLRPERVYTDGHTSVRRIMEITTLRSKPGQADEQSVLYEELAGRNRNLKHSMPISGFAAYAARTVNGAKDIAAACEDLGLEGWPMDDRMQEIAIESIPTDGHVDMIDESDRQRLERLAGLALALRVDGTRRTMAYVIDPRIVAAARVTQEKRLRKAA